MLCLPYCTSKPSLLCRSLPRFHFFDSFLLHLTVVSAPALRPLHSTPPLPPPRPHSFLSLNLYELMLILAISSHSVSHSPSLPHLPRQQQGHRYSAIVTRGMAARLGMAWPTAPTIQHSRRGVVGWAWCNSTWLVGKAGMCGVADVRMVVQGWMNHNGKIIQL